MYYFYVLYSLKDHRLYKGTTSDVGKRLIRHNAGGTSSTKHRRPFILIYCESYIEKVEATARERWSKSLAGGSELREKLQSMSILNLEGQLF
ncbi:MAG: GIY-YIG nuclease family protein [Bacteroidota bacterium]